MAKTGILFAIFYTTNPTTSVECVGTSFQLNSHELGDLKVILGRNETEAVKGEIKVRMKEHIKAIFDVSSKGVNIIKASYKSRVDTLIERQLIQRQT